MKTSHRRAARTSVHTVGAMVMLGYLGWIIHKSSNDALELVALGLVAILFVREMLHGAENVTARLTFKAGPTGVSGEIDPNKDKE